ncbi:hypothetical protein lerEdw1_004890 [Lerista edwardsae]|nr:hypothetical protein lerEdw1_004890 [Lerista edwardsae]
MLMASQESRCPEERSLARRKQQRCLDDPLALAGRREGSAATATFQAGPPGAPGLRFVTLQDCGSRESVSLVVPTRSRPHSLPLARIGDP